MNKLVLQDLNTKYLGRKIVYYEEIDSTQKEIFRKISLLENGTIILANKQTNGIGTHGRKWFSDKNNISFSFVLFPKCDIKKMENLTIQIAEIIKEVFEDLYEIELQIKMPNDLVFADKKIGGILTETRVQGKIVKELVIGIGINTNQEIFPKEINEIATSIKNEFNIEVDNKKIICEFCNRFEKEFIKRINDL